MCEKERIIVTSQEEVIVAHQFAAFARMSSSNKASMTASILMCTTEKIWWIAWCYCNGLPMTSLCGCVVRVVTEDGGGDGDDGLRAC